MRVRGCARAHTDTHHDAQNLTDPRGGGPPRPPRDRLYKSLESASGSPGVPSAYGSVRSAYSSGGGSAGTLQQSRNVSVRDGDGVRRAGDSSKHTYSSLPSAWEPSRNTASAASAAPAPAPREASVVAILGSLTHSMGSVASVGSRGSFGDAGLNGMNGIAFYKVHT